MKCFVFIGIWISGFCSLQAQNYYAIRNDGKLPQGYYLDKVYEGNKTVLLTQPSAETLSAESTIPFNFYFYNTAYTKYKVSDNGYLTFNSAALNSELPDTVLPENSIVAFGQDFKLQALPSPNEGIGVQVFSYTVGQAPNRRHIIQYHGVSLASDPLLTPITNASIYAFAIILHEGPEGRFDITYSPYGNKNIYGSIGCSSASNAKKFLLNDSLSPLPFQFSFNLENYIVYQFYYGKQAAYDLVIQDLSISKIYPVNAIVNFTGKLSNWGKNSVQSYLLNYSINGGDTISYQVSGKNLLPNGVGNSSFSHPVSWLSGSAGSVNDVHFWISAPNNAVDSNQSNNHFHKNVLRNNNNYIIDRNIIIEEGTGAWCGYCPEAHLIIAEAVKTHGRRVIPVSYHFDDSMSNPDALNFLSRYVFSYPDALIDRKIFLGSNNTWLNEVAGRLNSKVPVELTITMKSFNPQTREIRYRVNARFTDYWYGKLRIGSMVTENGVRGRSNPSIWSQNNFYSKNHGSGGVGGTNHPLYNELEFMHGYFHEGTHRASPGGVWGVEANIPELVAPDEVYFADFSYILPPVMPVAYLEDNNTPYCSTLSGDGMNVPAEIQLVGYIAEHDDNDVNNRPIINAVGTPLWDFSNALAAPQTQLQFNLFPNPAGETVFLRLESDNSSTALIEVFNAQGQVVYSTHQMIQSAQNSIIIPTSNFASGLFFLKIQTSAGHTGYRQFVVKH